MTTSMKAGLFATLLAACGRQNQVPASQAPARTLVTVVNAAGGVAQSECVCPCTIAIVIPVVNEPGSSRAVMELVLRQEETEQTEAWRCSWDGEWAELASNADAVLSAVPSEHGVESVSLRCDGRITILGRERERLACSPL